MEKSCLKCSIPKYYYTRGSRHSDRPSCQIHSKINNHGLCFRCGQNPKHNNLCYHKWDYPLKHYIYSTLSKYLSC